MPLDTQRSLGAEVERGAVGAVQAHQLPQQHAGPHVDRGQQQQRPALPHVGHDVGARVLGVVLRAVQHVGEEQGRDGDVHGEPGEAPLGLRAEEAKPHQEDAHRRHGGGRADGAQGREEDHGRIHRCGGKWRVRVTTGRRPLTRLTPAPCPESYLEMSELSVTELTESTPHCEQAKPLWGTNVECCPAHCRTLRRNAQGRRATKVRTKRSSVTLPQAALAVTEDIPHSDSL